MAMTMRAETCTKRYCRAMKIKQWLFLSPQSEAFRVLGRKL